MQKQIEQEDAQRLLEALGEYIYVESKYAGEGFVPFWFDPRDNAWHFGGTIRARGWFAGLRYIADHIVPELRERYGNQPPVEPERVDTLAAVQMELAEAASE